AAADRRRARSVAAGRDRDRAADPLDAAVPRSVGHGFVHHAVSAPWRREDGRDLVLTVHVQPGASRTEVAGAHGDALKVRLAAPQVEGRANAALVRYLAGEFGVAARDVTIERGETSRRKVVRISAPAKQPQWL